MKENTSPLMVTIRCLAYNHEPYIRQCLEGFVMQKTNFRFEAIVHDDASTDGTAAIIREYAKKYPDIIKPIFETENQYSKKDGSLRRIMDAHTHGKYVAICEGDDYWIDPLKLQKQVDFLETHPDYGMVYGKARVFNQCRNKYKLRMIGRSTCYENLLLKGNTIPTLTVMHRAHLVEEYVKVILPKWKMGDLPLWLFISHKSKIHFIDNCFGVYRKLIYSASSRASYESEKLFYESSFMCRVYFNNLYKNGFESQIEDLRKKTMFLCAFNHKKWNEALELYKLGFTKSYKDVVRYIIIIFCKLGKFFAFKKFSG